MAKIEFDTIIYEASHGKTPCGYRSWAFCENRGCRLRDPTLFFLPAMNYADAMKEAKAKMIERYGADFRGTLYVCP